jgi:hypothetical protein
MRFEKTNQISDLEKVSGYMLKFYSNLNFVSTHCEAVLGAAQWFRE